MGRTFSARGKTKVSEASRKRPVSRRKPVGDISNSVKPTPTQSLKRQNSTENDSGASKITFDGSKKKTFSEARGKQQTSGRKALAIDLSKLHEAPKKNVNTEVSVVSKDDFDLTAETVFDHNHEECLKCFEALTKPMDLNEFVKTYVFTDHLVPSSKMDPLLKPASPPMCMELEETSHSFPEIYKEYRNFSLNFLRRRRGNFELGKEPPKLKMKSDNFELGKEPPNL